MQRRAHKNELWMGHKRCIYRTVTGTIKSRRRKRRVWEKGESCHHALSEEEIRANGDICICPKHMVRLRADRKILRNKYDPGPLPLEG